MAAAVMADRSTSRREGASYRLKRPSGSESALCRRGMTPGAVPNDACIVEDEASIVVGGG